MPIYLEASCPRDVALRTPMAKSIRRGRRAGEWSVSLHGEEHQTIEAPSTKPKQRPIPSRILDDQIRLMQDSVVEVPFRICDYLAADK